MSKCINFVSMELKYLSTSSLGVVHPLLPLLSKVGIGRVAGIFGSLDESVDGPQQLTTRYQLAVVVVNCLKERTHCQDLAHGCSSPMLGSSPSGRT